MLTYIADFALGLFVGVYALASFAPKEVARDVYRTSWFFCGGFVLLAYFESVNAGPSAQRLLRGQQDHFSLMGLSGLEWIVILGIMVAFVGGMKYLKQMMASQGGNA